MKKYLKSNSGITVLSLIVSVVVLLILSAIAMYSVTGNGSVITNANTTVDRYNDAYHTEQDRLHEITDYVKDEMDKYNH